jgi:hypothetical protein
MARPEDVWHGWMAGKLFKITREHSHRPEFKVGDVVKCVMVSRMGDCGLTKDLKAERGYELRVMPWELDPVEARPEGICPLCNLHLEAGGHEGGHLNRTCDECGGLTGPCDPVCPTCCISRTIGHKP